MSDWLAEHWFEVVAIALCCIGIASRELYAAAFCILLLLFNHYQEREE